MPLFPRRALKESKEIIVELVAKSAVIFRYRVVYESVKILEKFFPCVTYC